MVPASFKGKYVIRFTVTSTYCTEKDIERDWHIIQNMAQRVLAEDAGEQVDDADEQPLSISPGTQKGGATNKALSAMGQHKREGMRRKDFGLSLILSNVPMSPKFINGSFAALFDANDIIVEYAKQLGRDSVDLNGQPIRLSPRKRIKENVGKQYSLDLNRAPCSKPSLGGFKQASLDSKIEELFDATTLESPEDTDEAESCNSGAEADETLNSISEIPPPPPPATNGRAAAGIHLNGLSGVSRRCKYCGHAFSDER